MTVKIEIEEFGIDIEVENHKSWGDDIINDTFDYEIIGHHIAAWYLMLDNDPDWDYWGNNDAGELYNDGRWAKLRCDSGDLEAWDEDGTIYFFVDKYDHSMVDYSLRNSKWLPDREWDVHTGLVYVPPKDLQQQYHKDKYKKGGKEAARAKLAKYAAAVLREYTDWCNGSVYGCHAVVYDKHGNELDSDSCWGFIGWDYAKETLTDEYRQTAIDMATDFDREYRKELIAKQKQAAINYREALAGQAGAVQFM